VGGRESIVHVDVAERRELFREARVVALLAGVEAGVLQKKHVAVPECGDGLPRRLAHAILGEGDRLAHLSREGLRDRLQRSFDIASLGAAEMGEQNGLTALLGDLTNRRHDALDPGRVRDAPVLHRHVEVNAQKHALAPEIAGIVEGAEGRRRGHGNLLLFRDGVYAEEHVS
jgi:hypothetical protein